MRHILFSVLFFCTVGSSLAQTPHSFMPKEGFVPTAEVAIRIAVAVWEPIYGQDNIERQKPYTAKLVNGVWRVEGYLPPAPDRLGGVALAEISQTDGRVLRVSHGQ